VEGAYAYGRDGTGLPGAVKLGGWRHFGDFDDLRLNTSGAALGIAGGDPFVHSGNHGLYAVFDQMIYRFAHGGEGSGISVFGRVAGSPSNRNQIDVYADAGVVITGLLPSRPADAFGIAFAYAGLSDDASGFDRDSGFAVVRDYEAVLEVSYTAEVVPGLYLQPDFQYFWHPGGHVPDPDDPNDAVEDAAVIGLRTTVNY
jgi:porin